VKKIPSSFKIMAHKITVRVIPKNEWKYDDAVGFWDPEKNEILLLKQPRTQLRHTFWHEVMHAVLDMMSHKQARDEAFVDQVSGLLSQIMDTAEF
jgi:Zn-dependent peptidase ImmA (M78 family)